jgi:butyrate kinase
MDIKILAINPGSTSTKIAIFINSRPTFLKSISHPSSELEKFATITDQYSYRMEHIMKELKDSHIDISKIQAIVARGGLLRPIKSGVYRINEQMKDDLKKGIFGQHASNLGGLIADDIAKQIPNCKSFIADPVVVDELDDVARYTGHPKFKRYSIFHALNQKAIGRAYGRLINRKYEELHLIIAHMGGGVSVGAHKLGRVVDVNQALDGEGPFSPERSGTLPAGALAKLCFEEGITIGKIKEMITGRGGLMAYLGTNNAYEVELMAEDGNEEARNIQDAMSYQIAKEIGALAAVLKGNVDAIILTGGISHNTMVVEYIKAMVSFIAPVVIYPGEDEMHALAWNGLLVIKKQIEVKEYDETNMVKFD